LLLSDRRIDEICKRLRAIPHLEVLRIGSRIPVTPRARDARALRHPQTVPPLYINTHFNHPTS